MKIQFSHATGILHFSNYFVSKELFSIFPILHKKHEKEIQKSAPINVRRDFEMQRSVFLESEQLHKRLSNILQDGLSAFHLSLESFKMMTSFHKSQKTSTLRPKPLSLLPAPGRAQFCPHPGISVQTQILGYLSPAPGRQENWYFRRGTAAEIHMEKVLSYAALMGRLGSREGTQGRALSTTKPRDRRKDFQ